MIVCNTLGIVTISPLGKIKYLISGFVFALGDSETRESLVGECRENMTELGLPGWGWYPLHQSLLTDKVLYDSDIPHCGEFSVIVMGVCYMLLSDYYFYPFLIFIQMETQSNGFRYQHKCLCQKLFEYMSRQMQQLYFIYFLFQCTTFVGKKNCCDENIH